MRAIPTILALTLAVACTNGAGATSPVGTPCAADLYCASGLCLTAVRPAICTDLCADDCDCPPGLACAPTTDGRSVCAPGESRCGVEPEPEPEPCVPDCRGRECGLDPVCGTSCGGCDDGNACTDDVCEEGTCWRYPRPDGIRECRADQVVGCASGVEVTQSCLDRCLAAGTNVSLGCGAGECECATFEPTCVAGGQECAYPDDVPSLARCVSAPSGGRIWTVESCSEICAADGWVATGECGAGSTGDEVCFCCAPECGGRECGNDGCGGTCGRCDYDERCYGGRCEPDRCQDCLDSCRGLPGCCTGTGCICDSECPY